MDAGAFVQENKRWLAGVAIGAVVWLVASAVVDSLHDARPPSERTLGAPTGPVFDQAAADAARAENEQLRAERERLQRALAFVQSDKYLLAQKGSADGYVFATARELRQTIVNAAGQREVQVNEASLAWETPATAEERRSLLFALELIDEVQQRLFAAHDQRRAGDEEAMGLRAITQLRPEARARQNQLRNPKPGEVEIRDLLDQERVQFEFQADEATAMAFYESCPKPDRNLVVDSWTLKKPAKPGDACTIRGTLLGIAFKPPVEGGN